MVKGCNHGVKWHIDWPNYFRFNLSCGVLHLKICQGENHKFTLGGFLRSCVKSHFCPCWVDILLVLVNQTVFIQINSNSRKKQTQENHKQLG
jgi:hypothetical protein